MSRAAFIRLTIRMNAEMAVRETRSFAIYQWKGVDGGRGGEGRVQNELSCEAQDAFTREDPFNGSAYREYRSATEWLPVNARNYEGFQL